jgi:hypothetical protein
VCWGAMLIGVPRDTDDPTPRLPSWNDDIPIGDYDYGGDCPPGTAPVEAWVAQIIVAEARALMWSSVRGESRAEMIRLCRHIEIRTARLRARVEERW